MNQQTKNIIAACQAVQQWCDNNSIPPGLHRHRLMRIVVMCVLTESGGHMYANANIPSSLQLPYDAIGHDHNSVGMFQQQVGQDGSNAFGWGTVAECMDIRHSTDTFLNHLRDKGLAAFYGPPLWERVQAVQVSAYPDGSNYRNNYHAAQTFLNAYAQAIHGSSFL